MDCHPIATQMRPDTSDTWTREALDRAYRRTGRLIPFFITMPADHFADVNKMVPPRDDWDEMPSDCNVKETNHE